MRRVVVSLLVLAGALTLAVPVFAPRRAAGPALAVLARLPADPGCTTVLGGLAALAQGLGPRPCPVDLGGNAHTAAILERVVHDRSRTPASRRAALAALGERVPDALVQGLLEAPDTPPSLRADAAALADPERLEAVALHGLHDRALARWFAGGEPGSAAGAAGMLDAGIPAELQGELYAALGVRQEELREGVRRHARGQLPIGLPTDWWEAFWHHDCADDCVGLLGALLRVEARRGEGEAEALPAPVPGLDTEVLDAVDGPSAADHVLLDLAAVTRWAARGGTRRVNRLLAVALHRGAEPMDAAAVLGAGGSVHEVLLSGTATPGAAAWTVEALGLALGVPVRGWRTPDGVALLVGGRTLRTGGCGPAVEADVDPSWPEIPRDGAAAMLLVEAAARALREGEDPTERLALARARWPEAPGLAAVEAAVLATRPLVVPMSPPRRRRDPPPPPPALGEDHGARGVMVPGGLFVHFPVKGEGPDARVAARQVLAERLGAVLAGAPDDRDRIRAAWWAAEVGNVELARGILAVVPVTGLDDATAALRAAILRRLGEPVGPAVAVSAPRCPTAWAAEPPIRAWAG